MKILNIEHFSEHDLIKRLRGLTMLTDTNTKPYEKAFISLENIAIDELFPAQRYVMKKELDKVRDLKWALEDKGYDLFNLNGFVRLTLDGEEEPVEDRKSVV